MTTMAPHPDFTALDWPREFVLRNYRLTPLTHAQVDEDYEAVMATAPLLGDFFGDWPNGLTREENMIDLAWHDREFTTKRSFSWIIRDAANAYIGCFYVSPEPGARGQAHADMWLCDLPARCAVAAELKDALSSWLDDHLPNEIALTWATSPSLD